MILKRILSDTEGLTVVFVSFRQRKKIFFFLDNVFLLYPVLFVHILVVSGVENDIRTVLGGPKLPLKAF